MLITIKFLESEFFWNVVVFFLIVVVDFEEKKGLVVKMSKEYKIV